MKRALVVLMAMMFAGMAVNSQAADVAFNPGSVDLTIEPGKSAVARLVVNGTSSGGHTIYMNVGTQLNPGGNLPPGWVQPAMAVTLEAAADGVSSTPVELVISVPADTQTGQYTAIITPEHIWASEIYNVSEIAVNVAVPSENACNGVPVLENVQIGPEKIWAPKNRKVEIDISGTVVVAPGCEVSGTYSMDSKGEPVAGDLVLSDDGKFDQKISILVAKKGKNKAGKTYNGTLSVVDAEGNQASQGFFVKVGHDRGKRKGHKKDWKKSWNDRWHKYWKKDR